MGHTKKNLKKKIKSRNHRLNNPFDSRFHHSQLRHNHFLYNRLPHNSKYPIQPARIQAHPRGPGFFLLRVSIRIVGPPVREKFRNDE